MEKKRTLTQKIVIFLLIIIIPLICIDQWVKGISRRLYLEADQNQIKPYKSHLEADQNRIKPSESLMAKLVKGEDRRNLETKGFACDVAENSIVCVSNKPATISTTNNITVYTPSIQNTKQELILKPYALRKDKYLLSFITPVKILKDKRKPDLPVCEHYHEVPAVIFSTGIAGNLFLEFSDLIIPLFITTRHFESKVQFIVDDYNTSFVNKFNKIISRLSSYEIINPSLDQSIHCFPGFILGLKYFNNLALIPKEVPGSYSMQNFRHFLRETYNLRYNHVSQIKKPRLILLSRDKKRRGLQNEDEIILMMKRLGYEVIIARTEDTKNMEKFSKEVNSCNVLVGVHGAGLTNMLFLPDGGVIVQIEALGIEWASENYYGIPPKDMGLHYLRYKVEPEESSLVELYGRNHTFITNPELVYEKGHELVKSVYLENQNVRVNVAKFKKTMVRALELVKRA